MHAIGQVFESLPHAILRPMSTLTGRTIALPETRELDLLARMVEQEGATTVRCPLLAIVDAPDPAPIATWIEELIDGRVDLVLLYTGEGVRRLTNVARNAGREAEFVEGLRRVKKIARGPKPVRALRELGLEPDALPEQATTDGLLKLLEREELSGHTVGVQLYGEEPNERLMQFLQTAGAQVRPVAPYRYASSADEARVRDLIERLAEGKIDLIAFTSSQQVERLFDVSKQHALEAELQAGLQRTAVAAVGPVAAEALRTRNVRVDVVPERSFTLKPLVRAMSAALAGR